MDKNTQLFFEARAKIIKSLAHPTRLFIVDQLKHGRKCVRELTDLIDADMSTVSKHLSLLKEAGIIQDEKQGLNVYYHLQCDCMFDFFRCVESVLRRNLEKQKSVVTEEL